MSQTLLRFGAARFAEQTFDDIRAFSKDPVIGVSRQGYSETENKVHSYIKDWAEKLALETRVDRCGNLFVTLPGADRTLPCYMTGSPASSPA